MKFKLILLVFAILALGVVPAFAQDDNNTISFNGFTFSFDNAIGSNVSIMQYSGDPADLVMPGAPEVQHTEFVLYSGDVVPAAFGAPAFVRVYKTADFAGYTWHETQLSQLQTLITEQPDLTPYMELSENASFNTLPFIPGVPAGQVIRARAAYVETEQVKGIVYLTIYRQDAAPAVANEFIYTFQGISTDGAHYVSAVFRPAPTAFPAEYEAVDLTTFDHDAYYADAVTQLNAAAPEDFALPLTLLDEVIASFSFSPA